MLVLVDDWILLLAAWALGLLLILLASSVLLALCALVISTRGLPPIEKGTVGFFHPNADGGGGGERVLWCAVKAVQESVPGVQVFIYAHEGVTAAQLVQDAQQRFNITLDPTAKPLQVVPLAKSHLLLPARYPRFTLIGQAVGSMRLGREALGKRRPELFIDTTGWAFTYPLAQVAGCKVASYTHYPTVSSDMITKVWTRRADFNNDDSVAGSPIKSAIKYVYYNAFALAYGIAGAFANVVMVNSSWTRRHVASLFWSWVPPVLVYPPCDTEQLQLLPLDRRLKQLFIVSVAQFRPEKDHRKQLQAFAEAKSRAGDSSLPNSSALRAARLKMVGSCRGAEDEGRLAALQQHARDLGIADSVDWHVNVPFSELVELLGDAVAGLHTMRDEHFGISVVEYMAAGAIPIAHHSAGPLEDIVVTTVDPTTGQPHDTGFLAETTEEYADAITQVLIMDQRERLKYASAARAHAATFSVEQFMQAFKTTIYPLLPKTAAA